MTDALVLNTLHDLQQPDHKGRPKPEVLYGRRKMLHWLRQNGHPDVSKHAVDRLMRVSKMNGLVRGRRTTTTIRAKDGHRAQDLLNRNFLTDAPDKIWITDFTYVATRAGFTYVAFVIELFSRRILSWASSTTHDTAFVEEALQLALWQRRQGKNSQESYGAQIIHHSDAGSEGGFKWSSQHLYHGGVCGGTEKRVDIGKVSGWSPAMGSGSGLACPDAFPWAA